MSIPFAKLPLPPIKTSSVNTLVRLIDGIGFRYQLATKGLTKNEYDFRPIAGSMNMTELLEHIYKVLRWTYKSLGGTAPSLILKQGEDYRMATLTLCQTLKNFIQDFDDKDLDQIQIYLKRADKYFSFWYLFNGPLADVLTHIGQINSWRRIAGNPVERISPFTGEAY